MSPELGVTPPSSRLLHSSIRCAPPCSAATADSTESAQISRMTGSLIGFRTPCNSPPDTVPSLPGDLFCKLGIKLKAVMQAELYGSRRGAHVTDQTEAAV